ncbi:MAG: pepP [Mycobacterium sp.]|nr:pepP [Mycobacterium sp.]
MATYAGEVSDTAQSPTPGLADTPVAAPATPSTPPLTETSPEAEPAPGTAGHDETVAGGLRTFMAQGWAGAAVATDPLDRAAWTVPRRAALSELFPGEALVVPTGEVAVRANDTDYVFRPGSDFFWLTGCAEPGAVLVMNPTDGGHATTLFVPDRSDRSTAAFFTDRRYGELWVGPRPGVAETAATLGLPSRPLPELDDALARLAPATTRVLRGQDPAVDAAVLARPGDLRDAELAETLSRLRLVKDAYEVDRLREAVAATVRGFEECVGELATARTLPRGERWLEGTFWRRARADGNDVGYTSIVAGGGHATTLHWVRNDGSIRDGDLLLLDMGVESDELYTADVTRTLPVSGSWTPAQRRVYEAVLAAQQAGIEAVRPGVDFLEPHRVAMRVLAEALADWGVLPVSPEDSLRDEEADDLDKAARARVGLHRRWTLHSTSHMLGIDVHDCAAARDEHYRHGPLLPGMVLTVEPGLYFQADDELVPEELRGIGVRIEDDILVTDDGHENLSAALPRDPDEVVAWMARLTG